MAVAGGERGLHLGFDHARKRGVRKGNRHRLVNLRGIRDSNQAGRLQVGTQFKEPQYEIMSEAEQQFGRASLGLSTNAAYFLDPKHLLFRAARYKFAAKVLEGQGRVLEVGCGDAFMTRLIQQHVGAVVGVDFDPVLVRDAQGRASERWPLDLRVHNMIDAPIKESFDAAVSLDVIEHILPKDEERFLENIVSSISTNGVFVVGAPSLESQAYASKESIEGHVNCKTAPDFRATMLTFFHNVFIFSMNDEVVHTGFHKMASYIFAVCVQPKLAPTRAS